jgi:hypothetical protein
MRHILVAASLVLALGSRAEMASLGQSSVRLVDMQARLFCQNRGSFSEDVIAEPPTALWNTPIGEGGAAGCHGTETLAVAVLAGAAGQFVEGVAFDFQARYHVDLRTRRDTIIRRDFRFGIVGPDGRLFVPLWLPQTGCAPVTLVATIGVGPTRSTRREVIEFACGE